MQKEDSPCRAGGVGYDHANPGVQTNADSKVTANSAVATNPNQPAPPVPEPSADSMLFSNNGVQATRTGMNLPDDLSEDDWQAVGRKLGDVETSYQWMVGDWWVFGEKHFENRTAIVQSPTWNGPALQTCMNCGVVCRAFTTYPRRYALTFKHHKEIVPLVISKPQLANEVLDWCEEPLKNGKAKPRSVANMKTEIRKRLDKHFEPLKRSEKAKKEDFEYIDFIGPISRFAEHKTFDIKQIARVQMDLFGEPQMLAEDINDCEKVVKLLNEFLKAIRPDSVPCCQACGQSLPSGTPSH
jgi:hypothetical protein